MTRPKVLIVGAGFAGFHCARDWSAFSVRMRPS
jgi:NADH dehydrogenase FAD-containing subunit